LGGPRRHCGRIVGVTDDAERTAELRPAEALPPDVHEADPDLPGAAVAETAEERRPRGERTLGRDLLAAGALAVVLTALGFPFAMLWQAITPRVEFVTYEGRRYPGITYSDTYVPADLYFVGLAIHLRLAGDIST